MTLLRPTRTTLSYPGGRASSLEDPSLIELAANRFGCQCVVIAIDAKSTGDHHAVYSHGGRVDVHRRVIEWAREAADRGAGEILLTSMDRDGTLSGYDLELTASVAGAVDVPVIASGGAGTPEHLRRVLVDGGADAVLAASIFHFDRYPVPETKRYLREHGVEVR